MGDETEVPKNRPEKKFRAGAVTATIWKAKEAEGKRFLVVFDKSYKDKEGNWKSTNHFTGADLATVGWLAKRAFDYIADEE